MAERMETPLQLASDSVYDCLCFGCEESGLQIEAQYFCKRCQRHFCENCVGHHNQIFKNHVVLGKGDKSDWSHTEATMNYITLCEQHPGETIKMFCKGHRRLCCIYCLHSDHRLCEQVVRIGEDAEEFDVEDHFKELPENILAKCEKFKLEHIDMEKQLETLQISYDETLLEIASFQKKMTDVIEKLGQCSTSELETMFTRINETCKNEMQRHTEINQRYKLLQRGIECIKQENKQLVFILCKKYDTLSEETDSLYERKDNRDINFRFQYEASMLQLVSELGSLGKIQTYRNNPNQVIKVSDMTKHDIRVCSDSGDSNKATIIDICELADGEFIIADSFNKKVKLLDDSFKVVSHLSFPRTPRQMCNVSAYSVALIFDDRDLNFIRVNRQRIMVERIITFEHLCYGIGYHNDEIFVTDAEEIYCYNLEGQCKHEISLAQARKCAVSPDGTTVYVTTFQKGWNSCLTLEKAETLQPPSGEIELNRPDGVHVTSMGRCLSVVVYFGDLGKSCNLIRKAKIYWQDFRKRFSSMCVLQQRKGNSAGGSL
ncbi:uncharacterized protein LOC127839842 [Dreissena polymorpha]|uniref:B box-type domain-containing protein n=1 Tax=Dreissena polymorpha TaxID=45954 RepID=A0A9D4FLX5_DREPO|nr:uncharacterized protein LOC127839842 [Dreissena polymorpha]KAH3799618.1 hypothetical protein DPMN_153229 [Dreissena polymorpha]